MQDLSGRPHLSFDLDIPSGRIGTFDTQLVEHFFQSLANTSGMTLHIRRAPLPAWLPSPPACCQSTPHAPGNAACTIVKPSLLRSSAEPSSI